MKPTTGLVLVILVLLGGVLLAPRAVPVALAQDPEPYLRSPQGPYRGRVVDAETGKPLPGALVLVAWEVEDVRIEGRRSVIAVREVLTDASGEFVVEAAAIETHPALLALPPRFFILAQGYMPFPEELRYPLGAPAARFRDRGDNVGLRPSRTEEERIMSFNILWKATQWVSRVSAAERLPEGEPRLLLLSAFFRQTLENMGWRERKGIWEPPGEPR